MKEFVSSNADENLTAMLDKHVNALAEHFDAVQIFVTTNDGSNNVTRCCNRGAGNWHARYGQIREWLIYEDARVRIAAKENS